MKSILLWRKYSKFLLWKGQYVHTFQKKVHDASQIWAKSVTLYSRGNTLNYSGMSNTGWFVELQKKLKINFSYFGAQGEHNILYEHTKY